MCEGGVRLGQGAVAPRNTLCPSRMSESDVRLGQGGGTALHGPPDLRGKSASSRGQARQARAGLAGAGLLSDCLRRGRKVAVSTECLRFGRKCLEGRGDGGLAERGCYQRVYVQRLQPRKAVIIFVVHVIQGQALGGVAVLGSVSIWNVLLCMIYTYITRSTPSGTSSCLANARAARRVGCARARRASLLRPPPLAIKVYNSTIT